MKRKLLLLSTVLNVLCVTGFEAGAVPLAELKNQLKQALAEGAEGPYALRRLQRIEKSLIGEQEEILKLLEKIEEDRGIDVNDDKSFPYKEDDTEVVTTRAEAYQILRSKKKEIDDLMRLSGELQGEAEDAIKDKKEAVRKEGPLEQLLQQEEKLKILNQDVLKGRFDLSTSSLNAFLDQLTEKFATTSRETFLSKHNVNQKIKDMDDEAFQEAGGAAVESSDLLEPV